MAATLLTAWRQAGQWSFAANRAKRSYLRWTFASLAMALAAAACGTLTIFFHEGGMARRNFAFASAVFVALLAVIARFRANPSNMRAWIRARAAAEGLKSEVYLCVMRAGPYREEGASVDVLATLSQRVEDITSAVANLNEMIADAPESHGDPPPDRMSVDEYLARRVLKQVKTYYLPRAARELRIVNGYRNAVMVLAIGGAVLAAWAGTTPDSRLAPWGAVVTTAMVAIGAHLATGRHEYQVNTFTATGLRLRRLSDRFLDARQRSTAGVETFVTECEAAILAENQGWMAQWEKPVVESPAAAAPVGAVGH